MAGLCDQSGLEISISDAARVRVSSSRDVETDRTGILDVVQVPNGLRRKRG